ncbi:MAG TPA: DUF523 and DUF1722 domain-containing protein [Vicinamibacterales bacterium]|nr:DUF523 and DUF1722 domain-containing protein [Vicinamibacterales bacterium]
MSERPRVGISRCLLGDEVRFDGGHKKDSYLLSTLGRFVEWVPVCPELEIGMGVPREPIYLVESQAGVRSGSHRVKLLGVESHTDWTSKMARFSATRVAGLAADLSGYVLKRDSPSCGLAGVRVHRARRRESRGRKPVAALSRTGRGLFAEALIDALPNLPIEEEDRLHDVELQQHFVERVFAYQRLRGLFSQRWTPSALVRFHTTHKLQLLAHSRVAYTALGRLVAAAGTRPRELAARYEQTFMRALATPATPGRHADVMLHIVGYLKAVIESADRHELLASIDEHRRGLVPLASPMALIRHHVRRHDVEYLRDQVYLNPRAMGHEVAISYPAS